MYIFSDRRVDNNKEHTMRNSRLGWLLCWLLLLPSISLADTSAGMLRQLFSGGGCDTQAGQ